jgi:hypothetical protein
MNAFKSPVARLAHLFQQSRDAWKAKALERQQRLRAAQVKIRDLEHSRAHWKARALKAERGADAVAAPTDDAPRDARPLPEDAPPVGHHYPVMVMQLTMRMYLHAGLGSRGVAQVLNLFGALLPAAAAPAHTTVLNWVYRCGLAILNRPPEWRADWIYVADHTIALGASKCLVILGIPANALPQTGYSPRHDAMQVLAVEITTHSTGAWVAAVLRRVAQRTGTPVQIVADHGSDLCKGIALFQQDAPGCISTYDISHRIATLLKAELGRDTRWESLLAHGRTAWSSFQQTDLAFLLPPRQRAKARFMNLDIHVRWAQRLLAYHDRGDFSAIRAQQVLTWPAWAHLRARFGTTRAHPLRAIVGIRYPDKAALCQALQTHADLARDALDDTFWHHTDTGYRRFMEGFAWLLPYREDLMGYAQLMAQSKRIQSHLKSTGLQRSSPESLQAALPLPSTLTPRTAIFTQQVLAHVALEAAKIPVDSIWLATSDIIESVFGKYKCFTAKGPLKEIGKLVLAIPAFIADLTTPLIREAMESVRTIDVEQWAETHIGTSMLARRRHALIDSVPNTKTA